MFSCGDEKAKNEITLGFANDFTGSLSSKARAVDNGARLALKEVNAGGGVLDNALSIEVFDSRGVAAGGEAAAKHFIDVKRYPIIFGPLGSDVGLKMLEFTVPAGVLLISPSNTSTDFTTYPHHGLYFRTIPSQAAPMYRLGDYLFATGHRRVAILEGDNAYAKSMATELRKRLEQLICTDATPCAAISSEIHYKEPAPSTYGFKADLDTVYGQYPDAVFLSSYPPEAIGYLNAWKSNLGSWKVTWIASDTAATRDVLENVGTTHTDGMLSASFARSGPGWDYFKNLYETTFAEEADARTAEAYDMIFLTALAINKAGSTDGAAVAAVMRDISNPPGIVVGPGEYARAVTLVKEGTDINYEGAAGPQDFDAAGDPQAPVALTRASGSQFVTIEVR